LGLILLKNFHAKSQSAQRKTKNLAVFAAPWRRPPGQVLREKKHKI
jgi:hypothetical protein